MITFTGSQTEDGVTEHLFKLGVGSENVPGVIWTPERSAGERPLLLMGHGRAQHKKTTSIAQFAKRCALDFGYATLAIDAPDHGERIARGDADRIAKQVRDRVRSAGRASEPTAEMVRSMAERARRAVPEWKAALDTVLELDFVGNTSRIGYWGLSMGTSIGIPFVASDPRVRCAVFGLSGLRPGSEELETSARAVTVPVHFAFQWNDAIVSHEHGRALFEAFGSKEKTMHINTGGHLDVPDFEIESWRSFFGRHLGIPGKFDANARSGAL